MFSKLFLAIVIAGMTSSVAFTQPSSAPKFKRNESYSSVRIKLIRAGWKPFKTPDADVCGKDDRRCKGRPEMAACAGTGLANCKFLWKRRGKMLAIFTIGEDEAIYSGSEFQ